MCAETTSDAKLMPVNRFRLHGLRKLNWEERFPNQANYDKQLKDTKLDCWIEPGPLMIIIGPNAGGKSTVIDLLRAIADASLWPTLARENYPGLDFSGFDMECSGVMLTGRFLKNVPDQDIFEKVTIVAVVKNTSVCKQCTCQAPKFPGPKSWDTELQALLDQYIGIKVHYYPATGEYLASKIADATLVELLNELSEHLPSVFANPRREPFMLFNGGYKVEGRIGVLFKDDPDQPSFVHRSMLPLGWMQLASVLHFLRTCEPASLILLDEPDLHMHPSLQRVLLELIARERARLGAQVFLATHSSVLLNPELCQKADASVITAARGRCEQLADNRRILDDLGVTSGDLAQANGVVWVEGPSDRIYLKRWLELYATHMGQSPLIERVHYVFVLYGGSLLKHLALSTASQDCIDLRSVNRNFAVVIDRDSNSQNDKDLEREKNRLLSEATTLKAEHTVWITQHYTVEAYLPTDWEHCRHIVEDPQGRLRVTGIRKVELAQRFAKLDMPWEGSYRTNTDLPERIKTLFENITTWQLPQEVITPACLQSCLTDC
jgi:energy-coupling factor transporter ATP-binding protein EcfA2